MASVTTQLYPILQPVDCPDNFYALSTVETFPLLADCVGRVAQHKKDLEIIGMVRSQKNRKQGLAFKQRRAFMACPYLTLQTG
ncbi:MAG: hypothetical protein PHR16_03660 [Methylovulum sp.]|nr:hypothetical protein [Methylovulum sp.]